jgi:ABC-type transporter Mla subunit MlaD
MTNDELERIMNFIIERQERVTEQQERTQSVLAETQSVLAELAARDGDKEQRIARFERSYTTIAGLLTKHDDQLVAVTSNVNKLTEVVSALSTTVDRYIRARGNNGAGGA